MAATQGAVTDISTANSTYLSSSVEEPELSSINFRQSLRFFQEQLINSNGFPSPSTSRSDVSKFCIDFANEHNRSEGHLSEGPRSLSNSRISIPTVDTILESVRVLRAIQKSQEQRGSTWSLNLVKSNSDLEIQPSIFEDMRSADQSSSVIENGVHDHPLVHKSSIVEDMKNVDQNSSLVVNGVQCSVTFPTTVDDKPCEGSRDKLKENNLMEIEWAQNNETQSFWPPNSIAKQEITTIINENTMVVSEQQTDKVQFQTSHLRDSSINMEIKTNSESTDCVLEEILHECNNDKNNLNENVEYVIANACEIDSDSSEVHSKNNTEAELPDVHCISKSSVGVKEILNQDLKSDIQNSETSEVNQTNINEKLTENGSTECEIDEKVNGNIPEDREYIHVTEDYPAQNDEPILKSIVLDIDGCQSTFNSPATHYKQLRPESRSDTCSSIYVSAEGSPCPSLSNDLESSPQMQEKNQAYSNQCVNNESKKDSPFETWTTDSSGICTDLSNDSRTNESTSSRSSTPCDTNILDDCTIPDTNKQFDEVYTPHIYFEDVPNIEEKKNTASASEETANPINSDEDSYHSFTLTDLITSPIPIITEHSTNHDLTNSTCDNRSDNRSDKLDENCSAKTITTTNVTDSNINGDDDNKASDNKIFKPKEADGINEMHGIKKFTTSSWNLEAITESLYTLLQPTPSKVFPPDASFQRTVFVMSQDAFCKYPEGKYTLTLQQRTLQILQEMNSLMTMPLNYAEVCITHGNLLKVDSKLGRCLYFKSETQKELLELKEELELHCLKCWESEQINLVHYPLKCHQNVVIIDLGSCSTRAGILMDQPTLPFLFFPSVCATNKITGNHVYGKEALQLQVRQNSNLSFPLRPSIKIIKHSIDIDLVGGLFKKIFHDLRVDPVQYIVQVCLPRSLSISAQNALVKLLLEDVKVQSVSLTHQALLTLYAHNVSTGVVVDIGDRMDILPVVDGFIVESGVTRLPYGGQRLIHHMKHALAEKHISLSNDIDSFVVQYISENLSYVAEDYDSEVKIAMQYPDIVKKTITLEAFALDDKCRQYATLDDARFKTPEGLFKPDLWGLDNPGIHKLVQKAIQATSVDVRKKIAENIFVSGGVTLIPGFVERLIKEVSNLNKPRIIPKVIASNYRYHCTYIGACEFARMEVFPKVCVNIEEYSKNQISSLKKFVMCF